MKILIVEDEKPAADKLESFLKYYDPETEIAGVLQSVSETINWFNNNTQYIDLILMDIQLHDGICFEIFNHVVINTPVIFITAYNQYAIEAFKVNSIDYLLKPLNYDNLYKSLEKYKSFKENILGSKERIRYEELNKLITDLNKSYKNRFMIKVGSHIKSITTDKIALFYAEGRDVSILTVSGKEYIIDYKLEQLEDMLDPVIFFRISRSYIVHIKAISDVIIYSSSRLKIDLDVKFDRDLIVSRDKVSDFKNWFSGDERTTYP